MDLLKNLNEKQIEAVTTIDGPLLILAGPGSGKTKTLTSRVAYLITQKIKPKNILAVTFTNKAAEEMKDKIAKLIAQTTNYKLPGLDSRLQRNKRATDISNMPSIGTFHSICVGILRRNAPLLGYNSKFSIYDDQDKLSLIKKVMKEMNINTKELAPQKIISQISNAKDDLETPIEYEEKAENFFTKQVAKIYIRYQELLKKYNGFDFDDLIMQTVFLLNNNPNILKKYQEKFKYILVDEYQDTNTAQYEWLRLLAKKYNNICVVGDDAQAIYSWRNAKVENILNFQHDWPSAKIIKLEQNYRSTKNIINAASALIKNNESGYPKKLWTKNIKGELITVKELENEYEEAEFILAEIERIIKTNSYAKKNLKYKLNDFVVLYRTNAQSRAIEEMFIRFGVPYKIVGGVKFYQRREIKDIIAWLHLTHNPNNAAAKERLEKLKLSLMKQNIPAAAGPGPAAAGRIKTKKDAVAYFSKIFLKKSLEEKLSLTKFVKYIVKKSNYEKMLRDKTEKGEERWQNIQELFSVTEDYRHLDLTSAINKFLEDVSLMQEADTISYNNDLVHLMTLHMAKGLEFPIVFIAGFEEGLLPHSSSMLNQKELEEERRLCYVGITRAKEKAYLLFTKRRMLWGSIQNNPPSSFLFELPQETLDIQPLDEENEYEDVINID